MTVRYRSGAKETVLRVSSVHESRGGALLLHEEGIAYFRRHEVASLEASPGGSGGRVDGVDRGSAVCDAGAAIVKLPGSAVTRRHRGCRGFCRRTSRFGRRPSRARELAAEALAATAVDERCGRERDDRTRGVVLRARRRLALDDR